MHRAPHVVRQRVLRVLAAAGANARRGAVRPCAPMGQGGSTDGALPMPPPAIPVDQVLSVQGRLLRCRVSAVGLAWTHSTCCTQSPVVCGRPERLTLTTDAPMASPCWHTLLPTKPAPPNTTSLGRYES